MSLAAYQAAQVAMIVDPGAAGRMGAGDLTPWADELTAAERARLVAQAADPGLALSRKLHQGWRLTKLLTLLPATFRVGSPVLLGGLVERYWRGHRPRGLYFEAEAAAFAAYVASEVPTGSAVHDAALLEGALLAVGSRDSSRAPEEVVLHLTHEPRWLLSASGAGGVGPDDPGVAREDAGYDVTVAAGDSGPTMTFAPSRGSG